MILDKGICVVYRMRNIAGSGEKPVLTPSKFAEGWYGELSYETSPARPTENRKEIRTDARVRILQNRSIAELDRVTLSPFSGDTEYYEVARAFHGWDDESGELITDLTLKKVVPWE